MKSQLRLKPTDFPSSDTLSMAPWLLGKQLVHEVQGHRLSGLITEVEAYLPDDPASHCYRGPTSRNQAMFGPPGTIYVYRSYGIHLCLNLIVSPKGVGGGILLRAIQPLTGLGLMKHNRGTSQDKILANGPGKLTQALAIPAKYNGQNIATSALWLEEGVNVPTGRIEATPRIGISKAVDQPYRFVVRGPLE